MHQCNYFKGKDKIYRSNADNSVKVMNINVNKHSEQPRQDFSTQIYEALWKWDIRCDGKYTENYDKKTILFIRYFQKTQICRYNILIRD